MKKTLLLLSILAISATSFAQRGAPTEAQVLTLENGSLFSTFNNAVAKTTLFIDTIYGKISFNSTRGHLYIYGTAAKDSGYISGMNVFGDKGYAQRYDFNGHDSGVQVLGASIFFAGTVNAATTKTVTVKCWGVGAQTAVSASRPHVKYSGLPSAVLGQSNTLSLKALGIYPGGDTIKNYLFTTPVSAVSAGNSFFTGAEFSTYSGTAMGGDTVAVVSDSLRTISWLSYSGADTILNDQTVVEQSNGTWDDFIYNTGNNIDFYILPILRVTHYNAGFKGVTRNDLTWYGNYPNPATNNTNIKFALSVTADVTVEVMEMNGRKIDVITESGLSAGTHEIAYNTSKLAAGNYIYTIRTNTGAGMASMLSVVK